MIQGESMMKERNREDAFVYETVSRDTEGRVEAMTSYVRVPEKLAEDMNIYRNEDGDSVARRVTSYTDGKEENSYSVAINEVDFAPVEMFGSSTEAKANAEKLKTFMDDAIDTYMRDADKMDKRHQKMIADLSNRVRMDDIFTPNKALLVTNFYVRVGETNTFVGKTIYHATGDTKYFVGKSDTGEFKPMEEAFSQSPQQMEDMKKYADRNISEFMRFYNEIKLKRMKDNELSVDMASKKEREQGVALTKKIYESLPKTMRNKDGNQKGQRQ